jgi:hypothetical protein
MKPIPENEFSFNTLRTEIPDGMMVPIQVIMMKMMIHVGMIPVIRKMTDAGTIHGLHVIMEKMAGGRMKGPIQKLNSSTAIGLHAMEENPFRSLLHGKGSELNHATRDGKNFMQIAAADVSGIGTETV